MCPLGTRSSGAASPSCPSVLPYEDAGDGWVTARVAEVPGAISEGATRAQAKENVIDALRGILELRFGEHALSEPIEDSEALELVIAA